MYSGRKQNTDRLGEKQQDQIKREHRGPQNGDILFTDYLFHTNKGCNSGTPLAYIFTNKKIPKAIS